MKIKTLTKREVEEAPYLIWNAFIELVALTKYQDLAEEQRPAHLVFMYDSEVYNGGHLQYFGNRRMQHLGETIEALRIMGAECQRLVLNDAAKLFLSRQRSPILTVEDFSTTAQEGEFSEFDSRIYACAPSLHELLQKYLALHQSWFVTIA
jgi:hypothetical protein